MLRRPNPARAPKRLLISGTRAMQAVVPLPVAAVMAAVVVMVALAVANNRF